MVVLKDLPYLQVLPLSQDCQAIPTDRIKKTKWVKSLYFEWPNGKEAKDLLSYGINYPTQPKYIKENLNERRCYICVLYPDSTA